MEIVIAIAITATTIVTAMPTVITQTLVLHGVIEETLGMVWEVVEMVEMVEVVVI